jgi:hypothetical protein
MSDSDEEIILGKGKPQQPEIRRTSRRAAASGQGSSTKLSALEELKRARGQGGVYRRRVFLLLIFNDFCLQLKYKKCYIFYLKKNTEKNKCFVNHK